MAIRQEEGVSQREFARSRGMRHSYIQRLIKRGTLPVLPNGRLDVVACDRAMARNRKHGDSPRNVRNADHSRHAGANAPAVIAPATEKPICQACKGPMSPNASRQFGTREWQRFCTPECEADYVEGFTPSEIAERSKREWACLGYLSPRGGGDPIVLELVERGIIKESELNGITEERLAALVEERRGKLRKRDKER